jgi:hypothetical protein
LEKNSINMKVNYFYSAELKDNAILHEEEPSLRS